MFLAEIQVNSGIDRYPRRIPSKTWIAAFAAMTNACRILCLWLWAAFVARVARCGITHQGRVAPRCSARKSQMAGR